MSAGEFFIGWAKEQPPGVARRVRQAVGVSATLAVLAAALFVLAQRSFATSSFEFTRAHPFAGVVFASPVPALWVSREDAATGGDGLPVDVVPLVAPGKFGAGALVAPFDGKAVTLEAKTIERAEGRMLEVVPGSIREAATNDVPSGPRPSLVPLEGASVRLTGEIVDGKCFLGVMNPGEGKVHRDCAARCIAGGVPPALLVRSGRDGGGGSALLFLVDEDGASLGPRILDLVAEPVAVDGQAFRLGDLLILRTAPARIRRVG